MTSDFSDIDVESHKIVFAGAMGAGKTTAIRSISDVEPVSTDVENFEGGGGGKLHTTVAMDFGKVKLDDKTQLSLYGTPGQERFKFMWPIVSRDAFGLVFLINNNSDNPLELLDVYLKHFRPTIDKSAAVVGITCSDLTKKHTADDYQDIIKNHSLKMPAFSIDARRRDDVLLLLNAVLSLNEAKRYHQPDE
jgi:signal recognition particle receptor subunit beta